eukprot:g11772.t1
MASASASNLGQTAPPVGTTTVKALMDWAASQKKPPRTAPLPHTFLKCRLSDGAVYSAADLQGVDPGESEELAQLIALAKGGIKQDDSPRAEKRDKQRKATFLIQVAGGPKKHHDASIALATSTAIKDAVDLRGLSMHDPVCLEILSQSYVSHFFKKIEDNMTAKKITTAKQMRTIRVLGPGLAVIGQAASLLTTMPILKRIIEMIAGCTPMKTDLKEDAYKLWRSLNPSDKDLTFAYEARDQIDRAVDRFKYNSGAQASASTGPGLQKNTAEGGDGVEGTSAGSDDEHMWGDGASDCSKATDVSRGAKASRSTPTAANKKAAAKAKNQKASAKGKAQPKGKAGKNATPTVLEDEEANHDVELGGGNNKRSLAKRSPDGKLLDGEKAMKIEEAGGLTAAKLAQLPTGASFPSAYTNDENLTLAGKHLASLRQMKAEDASGAGVMEELEPSWFDVNANTDRGKVMLELKEPLRNLATTHADEVAAESYKKLYDEWNSNGKPAALKLENVVENSADNLQSRVTLRSILLFLQLLFPGMMVLDVLARDLGVFTVFGLPMAAILSIQSALRDAMDRVQAGLGLRGDLLAFIIVKSNKVPGLTNLLDLCQGKWQGLLLIRKNFQDLLLLPQQFHHTAVEERRRFNSAALDAVFLIADGDYSNLLPHDVGLILYCAQFVKMLFSMMFGIRSLRAKKRQETATALSWAVVSARHGALREYKDNMDNLNSARKMEQAIKKWKAEGLSKVEMTTKKAQMDFRAVFCDEAAEIYEIVHEKLVTEIQRYGPFPAALEDAIASPSVNSIAKKPSYGADPFKFKPCGEMQMDKIKDICKNGGTDDQKKEQLRKILEDVDNWETVFKNNDEEKALTKREECQEGEYELVDEEVMDEFQEEAQLGGMKPFLSLIFNN